MNLDLENTGVSQAVAEPETSAVDTNTQDNATAKTTTQGDDATAVTADAGDQQAQVPNEVWKTSRERAEREAETKFARKGQELLQRIGATVNPFTNKPFESLDEYAEAVIKSRAEEAKSSLQTAVDSGATAQEIDNALQIAVSAQRELERLEQAKKEVENSQVDAFAQTQFADLSKAYGVKVDSFDDLLKLPNSNHVIENWGRGLSLSDAYFLANKDSVLQQNQAATKQAALNAVNGKSHLSKTTGNAANDNVSGEELAAYKQYNPNATEKDVISFKKRHPELYGG